MNKLNIGNKVNSSRFLKGKTDTSSFLTAEDRNAAIKAINDCIDTFLLQRYMEDYKERLLVEQKELKEKFIKLEEFINSDKFYKLSTNNRQILKNLKIVMELYLSVLNMRIYEDIDKIVVPDLGFMQMMGNVFGGNSLFNFPKSEDIKPTEENAKE